MFVILLCQNRNKTNLIFRTMTSRVTVYINRRPAKNIRVAFEYTGLTNLGFTKAVYTNDEGVAYVEHSSSGEANVYLNGSMKGKMRTPGQEVFYL